MHICLTNLLYTGTAISYADDTILIIKSQSFEDLFINAFDDLGSLVDYLKANKFSITLSKQSIHYLDQVLRERILI